MESGGGTPPAGALGAAAESPPCPLPPGAEGAAGPAEPDVAAEGAGSGSGAEDGGGPRRALRAVYVHSESPQGGAAGGQEAGARQCLLRACEAEGAQFISVPFGELDFGETAVLDAFYDAGEADAPFTRTPRHPTLSAFLTLAHATAPAPPPPQPSLPCLSPPARPAFPRGQSKWHCTFLQIRKRTPLAFKLVIFRSPQTAVDPRNSP